MAKMTWYTQNKLQASKTEKSKNQAGNQLNMINKRKTDKIQRNANNPKAEKEKEKRERENKNMLSKITNTLNHSYQ